MKRFLLLASFVGLMADGMFGWGLGLAPGLSLKNMLLYILVVILGIEGAIAGKKLVIELPQVHVLFVLLFFLALISWAANSFIGMYTDYSPFRAFISLKGNLLDHYLFFLVFFLGVRSEADVLWLQRWLLFAIAAGNIITLMDAYNLPDLNVIETRRDGRVGGPLGEANQYGLFVAMFLPILLARAWTERSFWRLYFGMATVATFLVLLLTVSRGAFLALILGSLCSAILLKKHLNALYVRRVLAFGVLAAIGAALVLGQEYSSLISERMRAATSGGDAHLMTSGRTWIWSTAFQIMMNEPAILLTGYGWNTFRGAIGLAPHNVYLGHFFELGILGLLLFGALMFSVLVFTRQSLRLNSSSSGLVPGLIGFFFGFFVLTIGIFTVDLANPWYFIWAYAGLALRSAMLLRAGSVQDAEMHLHRQGSTSGQVFDSNDTGADVERGAARFLHE